MSFFSRNIAILTINPYTMCDISFKRFVRNIDWKSTLTANSISRPSIINDHVLSIWFSTLK